MIPLSRTFRRTGFSWAWCLLCVFPLSGLDCRLADPGAQRLAGAGGLMGTFSIWHWIIVLLALSANVPAYWAIKRTGWSGWLLLSFYLPPAGIAFLWVLAYVRWPARPGARAARLAALSISGGPGLWARPRGWLKTAQRRPLGRGIRAVQRNLIAFR